MRKAFALAAADYGNVGDALIRRCMVDWAADYDELNLYVGSGSSEWIEALRPGTNARIWRRSQALQWLMSLIRTRGPLLLFDPGEVRLGRDARKQEAAFLLITVVARLRGGMIVRPGRGVVGSDYVSVWLHRLSCRLSHAVSWRNRRSRDFIGSGEVVPDVAFGTSSRLDRCSSSRSTMVVSLRADRPLPNVTWLAAVAEFARESDLKLICVAQVRGDQARTLELAELLESQSMGFTNSSLALQESLLRDVYSQARLVLSDRLHVLVLATLCGAAPLEMVPCPTSKIREHFEVIGLRQVSRDSGLLDKNGMKAEMASAVAAGRVSEIGPALAAARERVDALASAVRLLVTKHG